MKIRRLPFDVLFRISKQEAILLALASEGPLDRYQIAEVIEKMLGIKMKHWQLNFLLPRMTRDGYVRICCKRDMKNVYEITPLGLRLLKRQGLVR